MARVGIIGVSDQSFNQEVAVEAIDAHRDVGLLRVFRRRLGVRRLLLPADDAIVVIDFHHAERGGQSAIEFDGPNGDVRPGLDVLLEHQLVIHLVNVVAGKDQNILAGLAPKRVQVLVDGVGGSLVPVFSHPPHGGQNLDELAQFIRGELLQPSRMCRLRESALYWVTTKILRRSELMQFERVMSTIR